MSFQFSKKTLRLINLNTRTAINAKISLFVICVEGVIYLQLYICNYIICMTVHWTIRCFLVDCSIKNILFFHKIFSVTLQYGGVSFYNTDLLFLLKGKARKVAQVFFFVFSFLHVINFEDKLLQKYFLYIIKWLLPRAL